MLIFIAVINYDTKYLTAYICYYILHATLKFLAPPGIHIAAIL